MLPLRPALLTGPVVAFLLSSFSFLAAAARCAFVCGGSAAAALVAFEVDAVTAVTVEPSGAASTAVTGAAAVWSGVTSAAAAGAAAVLVPAAAGSGMGAALVGAPVLGAARMGEVEGAAAVGSGRGVAGRSSSADIAEPCFFLVAAFGVTLAVDPLAAARAGMAFSGPLFLFAACASTEGAAASVPTWWRAEQSIRLFYGVAN